MSVLDFADLTMCKNKIRKHGYFVPNGYDEDGRMMFKFIPDRMNQDCKYDRKSIDPACNGCTRNHE